MPTPVFNFKEHDLPIEVLEMVSDMKNELFHMRLVVERRIRTVKRLDTKQQYLDAKKFLEYLCKSIQTLD